MCVIHSQALRTEGTVPRFTVMLDKIHSLIFSVVNHCKSSPQEYSQCWDDLRACFERMFAGAKELIGLFIKFVARFPFYDDQVAGI